jgi:hypothetical protein
MKFLFPLLLLFAMAACKTPSPTTAGTSKPAPVDNYKMADKTPVTSTPENTSSDTANQHNTVPTVNDYKITIKQDSVLMTMSKGYCYGNCPVFSISISGSGRAVYQGKKNVPRIGIYEKELDWKEVMHLATQFENAGIFDMADSYPPPAADLPRTTVSFYYGGREKKINGTYNAPQQLQDIVKVMTDFTEGNGWTKIGDLPKE